MYIISIERDNNKQTKGDKMEIRFKTNKAGKVIAQKYSNRRWIKIGVDNAKQMIEMGQASDCSELFNNDGTYAF